jgi:16S rRNA (uracil1498-N3)-methyltransferase
MECELSREQGNYLGSVLRCKEGDELFLFNAQDGEFRAIYKNKKLVEVAEKICDAEAEQPLILLFAPVKFGKIDMLAQKATELGATVLQPVHTKHTHISRINYERLKANAIEAAEQTGRLTIPEVKEAVALDKLIANWDAKTKIIFCDDSLEAQPIAMALNKIKTRHPDEGQDLREEIPKQVRDDGQGGYAMLIGPEGGFSADETKMLKSKDYVVPVTMGKRLLRAETAALAALAVFQSIVGDWNG